MVERSLQTFQFRGEIVTNTLINIIIIHVLNLYNDHQSSCLVDHLDHLYDDNLYGGIQGSGRKQFFSALGKVSAGLTTVDVTQLPSSAFIKPCQTMLYHTMCLQKGNFPHCTSDALGPSRRPKKQDLDVPNHVSPL